MSVNRDREEEIFDSARELAADERAAYLANVCGQDADLRQQIEGMLAADAAADEFFNTHGVPTRTVILAEASLSPSIEKAGDKIGRYKLLQQIGEGGMGLVYMAEQDQPVRRSVALKVIKLGMDTRQVVARFEAERQALAMMNHPHIAKIFDAGATDSGRPYFVMELVRGIPITEYCDRNLLPTRERLDLFVLVCQAVQHAHQKGVIHRDLKPSNILVTLNDGVPWPMVIDFGIAKATNQRLTEKTIFTHFAQMIGTPAYMSPEQAEMSKLDVDTRTDIYALGVLLYELLTGTTPFPTRELLNLGYQEMQRTIAEKEPPRLSTRLSTMANEERTVVAKNRSVEVSALAKLFRGDLDWIATKCLEKDRTRRYETANGLAADIQRYVNNEPVMARPPSNSYRLQKLIRRNKLAFVAGAGIAMVLLLGIVGSTWQAARATRAEREARQQLFTALWGEARATVRSGVLGHRVRALEALRLAASISNRVELRREVFAALALPDLRFEREVSIGSNVTWVACDPFLQRMALARGVNPIEIRSLSDGALLAALPPSTNLPAHVIHWSPDGHWLAVKRDRPRSGLRADWEIWDVSSMRRQMLLQNLLADTLSFHPRENHLLTVRGSILLRWNLANGEELARYPLSIAPTRIEVALDGKQFATVHTATNRQIVTVWEDFGGPAKFSWTFADWVVLRWHPLGKWLAVADYGGKVQLLDPRTGEIQLLGRHKVEATTLAFSPQGDYLVSGGWEREMICWDLRTLAPAFAMAINSHHLQFSADGRRCATVVRVPNQFFQELKLYEFERTDGFRGFQEALGSRLDQAAFSLDGRWFAASGKNHVGVWDLSSIGPGALTDLEATSRLYFTPDASELFGSSREGGWMRWQIGPGVRLGGQLSAPQLQPVSLSNPKGFNSVCLASNMIVWTCSSGSRLGVCGEREKESLWTPTEAGRSGVSPDGRWLGIYQWFGTRLNIYRLPSLEPVALLTTRASVYNFCFSPDGNEVAVASGRLIEFWSTSNWQRTRTIADFMDVLYGKDGRTLWLIKDYSTAGLYDAKTLDLLLPLPSGMLPLALSSDGRQLAVSVDLRRVQVWDLAVVRQQLAQLNLDWRE
jgi:serine/threonine protein kinase/WD40 repeat protein